MGRRAAPEQPIGDLARRDVPTCELQERVGAVQRRVAAAGWDRCVVINQRRVVLGLLAGKRWRADPETPVKAAMLSGPSTFRPHVPVAEIVHFLHEHDMRGALVTASSGELLGYLPAEKAARALHAQHAAVHAGEPGAR